MLGAVQGDLLISALSPKLVACWSRRKPGGGGRGVRQALDATEENEGSAPSDPEGTRQWV